VRNQRNQSHIEASLAKRTTGTKAQVMDGSFNLITLLSLVVAVIVIFKLRNVLGQRTTDDEERIDRNARAQREAEREQAAREKVVTLPPRRAPDQQTATAAAGSAGATANADVATATAEAEAKLKTFANGDPAVEHGLMKIFQADPAFDAGHFLTGSKQAYEMLVMAFAEGNRKVLKDLLSREVFEGFSAAITDRESRGEQIDQSFVGINRANIVEAEMKGGTAQLTVKFVSQLISATRDRAGLVTGGDPQKIKEVTDIWTFARDISARSPNWRLIATQSPG
jgi:predicted lipid-binding transport protein (Tim44 family)